MEKFIQFIIDHWVTWAALLIVIIFIVYEETKDKLHGIVGLSPQDATRMLNRDEAIVFDVRDENAFSHGHIVSAVHIPAADLSSNDKRLAKYKDKAVVVVAGDSTGSHRAVKILRTFGFSKLYVLSGGVNAWRSAGLPLTKK